MEQYNETVVANDNVNWQPIYPIPSRYDYTKQAGEANYQPSRTIPDQAMSINEILDRYRRGLSFTNGKIPIYDSEQGDTLLVPPDWDKMDLSEQHDYKIDMARKLAEFRKRQRQELDKKVQEDRKQQFFKEFEAMKQEQESKKQPPAKE